jgi:uncharacterized protein (TIGR02687 family)
MSHTVIQKSLTNHFARHRVVFWYDASGEWVDELQSLSFPDVEALTVKNDELAVKFRVLRDQPHQNFLLYFPSARPNDDENWLLDILLSNAEFHADRASLHLDDVGLPPEFKDLTREHARFFETKKNREALKKRLQADDTQATIRRRMMAVLLRSQDDSLDSVILHLAKELKDDDYLDPVALLFNDCALEGAFWKEIERQFSYRKASPTLLDFMIEVFRRNAPIGTETSSTLSGQAIVFLSRWKDSKAFKDKFRELSARIANDLRIREALVAQGDLRPLIEIDVDAYEDVEKAILSHIRGGILEQTLKPEDRRAIIERRSRSTWNEDYADMYQALYHAGELFERIDALDLQMASVSAGLDAYTKHWWRVDYHYRKFQQHCRKSGQGGFLEETAKRVEARYLNDYHIHLATRWEDVVGQQSIWPPQGLPAQRDFFRDVVKPFIDKGQKLFVIISDALRYECAHELLHRFLKEDRYQAELEASLANLPTFTQMGMAALFPHEKLKIAEDGATVTSDGQATAGTEARQKLLSARSGVKAKVLQASEFLGLNTKTEGRPLMREHELFYILHNVIDKVGDDKMTERDLTDACARALDEVMEIAKKIANINGTNMVIASDHGFLFQQSDVDDADCPPMPTQGKIAAKSRRWVMGTGLKSDSAIRVYEPSDLGLDGDQQVGIVKGIQRLPIQGSGKRFVHGGAMPQEVIIPILTVNKARTSTVRSVTVEILSVPNRITTTRVPVRLYQKEPVSDAERIQPLELRLGLYGQDGKLLSDQQTISFQSKDQDPRQRETQVSLTLGHDAEAYNNKDVVLRLEETIPGTSHLRTHAESSARLVRHFGSDFDEF